ncbi:MAG: hypothetical protein Q4G28_01865 [Neisseria sp.]|nr:hypothetical protein [Neisseria sp.]
MNMPKQPENRVKSTAWGGIPALLASREFLNSDAIGDLNNGELCSLAEYTDAALIHAACIMETVGRLVQANETADDTYKVGSEAIGHLMAALNAEIGGAVFELAKIRTTADGELAYRSGYNAAVADAETDTAKAKALALLDAHSALVAECAEKAADVAEAAESGAAKAAKPAARGKP